MKKIFILDGVVVTPNLPVQADEDDKAQTLQRNETEIFQPTELGETLKELNKDVFDTGNSMSDIDLKTRITDMEKTAYHAFDSLVTLKFFPSNSSSISRVGKRLAVSLKGEGRKEIVDIVRGVKDAESKSGFLDKMGGMFGGKK